LASFVLVLLFRSLFCFFFFFYARLLLFRTRVMMCNVSLFQFFLIGYWVCMLFVLSLAMFIFPLYLFSSIVC
jgi:hypothetical protein